MPIIPDPIDWLTIENALYDWFQEQADIAVIWGNQDAPQPPYPYGTITIISGPNPVMAFDERVYNTIDGAPAGEEVQISTFGDRNITVSLQAYVGPPDNFNPAKNARAIMSRVQASMAAQSVIEFFRSKNIAMLGQQPMQNIDEVIEDTWISRANMDAIFGFSSLTTEKYGYIKETLVSAPAPFDFDDKSFGDC